MADLASGNRCFLEIDGTEFEARDWAWQSDILQLSDQWSVTLPCPEGKSVTTDGKRVPVAEIKPGAKVRFFATDPNVEGGAKLLKMTGRLVTKSDGSDDRGGYVLNLAGFDLGWHLTTGHGPVFKNIRGVSWTKFIEELVLHDSVSYSTKKLVEDASAGISRVVVTRNTTLTDNGWGFAGVRLGTLEGLSTKIGPRAAIEAARFKGTKEGGKPQPGAIQPRFQVEVGQSIGPLLIELAKWQRFFVNVSADGWLQFFQPTNASTPFYYFHHELARERQPMGNIRNSRLTDSADGLYTRTECWTSIVTPPANADSDDPNFGRYKGAFDDPDILPFIRRHTFSDPNQLGKEKASERAKWAHDRGVFDSWQYTFRVQGHSQDGMPFEPDTIASLRDTVRGLSGNYYVQSVRCARILPSGGVSSDAGTYSDIVLRKTGLLGA